VVNQYLWFLEENPKVVVPGNKPKIFFFLEVNPIVLVPGSEHIFAVPGRSP